MLALVNSVNLVNGWMHQVPEKGAAAVPLSVSGRGSGSPSNTLWSGPRSTSLESVILIHPAVWHGPKIGGSLSLWVRGSRTEAYLHTKWHLDPSSCLATIHVPFFGDGEAGSLFKYVRVPVVYTQHILFMVGMIEWKWWYYRIYFVIIIIICLVLYWVTFVTLGQSVTLCDCS